MTTREHKIVLGAIYGLAAVVFIRNAWLSDDAYITLRTIDNFVNGYGLRWNIGERVQAFTSPLWTILLSIPYFVTREEYFTTIFFAIATSLLALWSLLPSQRTIPLVTFIFAAALSSPAFVFYSVSGLETPLSLLLLGLLYTEYLGKGRLPRIVLLFSLLTLTRHDLSLLGILPLIDSLRRNSAEGDWIKALPGFIPLIVWEMFSLIYYGSFVPNTAYAKLPSDISTIFLLKNGLAYYLDAFDKEPLTLIFILAGIATALVFRTIKIYIAVSGILFYLIYILYIGGDFMSGRFFGPPFGVALLLLGHTLVAAGHRIPYALAALCIAASFLGPYPPLLEGSKSCCGKIGANGIAEEKQFYFKTTGLLNWRTLESWPSHHFANIGREAALRGEVVALHPSVGMIGFFSGPSIHIIDPYGLADPLLSQLTPVYSGARPGHYYRIPPQGYEETIKSGESKFKNQLVGDLYSAITIVTKRDLFSKERLDTILSFMVGKFNPLKEKYRKESMTSVDGLKISTPKKVGTHWADSSNTIIPPQGIRVFYNAPQPKGEIELSLDHNNEYLVRIFLEDDLVSEKIFHGTFPPGGGLDLRTLNSHGSFDSIYIYNISPDPLASLGHVKLGTVPLFISSE